MTKITENDIELWAIEKRGNIPTNEMIAFMNSEIFMNAVKSYLELMK